MILCIGEILVDLIAREYAGDYVYKRFAGGAPFNVCCAINKFGEKSVFVGSVGDDIMGKFLVDFAQKNTFSHKIKKIRDVNTTLAFVNIDKDGEREFSFFRNKTAEQINFNDIPKDYLLACDVVHIGSFLLTQENGIKVIKKIIDFKNKNNKLLCFDVNFRRDIFDKDPKKLYWEIIKHCDIIKLSEDELFLLTDEIDIEKALSHFSNLIVLVTLGAKGSLAYFKNKIIFQPTIKIKPKDTTGAGDAFLAGFLSKFNKDNLNEEELVTLLKFANLCGALTTTKDGAIDALPTVQELFNFQNLL